jgi:hypothetical protein
MLHIVIIRILYILVIYHSSIYLYLLVYMLTLWEFCMTLIKQFPNFKYFVSMDKGQLVVPLNTCNTSL